MYLCIEYTAVCNSGQFYLSFYAALYSGINYLFFSKIWRNLLIIFPYGFTPFSPLNLQESSVFTLQFIILPFSPFWPLLRPPSAPYGLFSPLLQPLSVPSNPLLQPLSISSNLFYPASSLASHLYVLLCLVLLTHSAPIEVCFSSAPMPYFLPGQSLPFFTFCNVLLSRKAL